MGRSPSVEDALTKDFGPEPDEFRKGDTGFGEPIVGTELAPVRGHLEEILANQALLSPTTPSKPRRSLSDEKITKDFGPGAEESSLAA